MTLVRISRRLSREVDALSFQEPVSFVYNPLSYARDAHETYLQRFGGDGGQTLLLGSDAFSPHRRYLSSPQNLSSRPLCACVASI